MTQDEHLVSQVAAAFDVPETLVNPKATAATRDQKPPLHLLEHAADVEIARALATGAKKYGERNYQTIPISASVYAGAIRRHVGAWLDGEDVDPESGINHLAHVGANVHVLLDALKRGNFKDDRGPGEQTQAQRSNEIKSNGATITVPHVTGGRYGG